MRPRYFPKIVVKRRVCLVSVFLIARGMIFRCFLMYDIRAQVPASSPISTPVPVASPVAIPDAGLPALRQLPDSSPVPTWVIPRLHSGSRAASLTANARFTSWRAPDNREFKILIGPPEIFAVTLSGEATREAPVGTEPHPARQSALRPRHLDKQVAFV